MNDHESPVPNRAIVVHTLAVVGFIALIGASMWLAVYSTRYVPAVVTRLGSAAVYLGSVFTPSEEPALSVVPTASSTVISFGEADPTPVVSATVKSASAKPVAPIAGPKTIGTYQIGGAATTTPSLAGFPDFVVTIRTVGYLATTSAESFIASTTVPVGGRPAVNFTIQNAGTNVSGAWRFSASIPTASSYIYQSQPQQSLAPGDSIEYTLGFDQAIPGIDKMISISANFDRAVTESNFDNNSASTKVIILGS